MENTLRVIHEMDDGTLRLHYPCPGSRLVTAIRAKATGAVQAFTAPTSLYAILGVYEPEKFAQYEIIEGESDVEHIARTAAKSAECIQREKPGRKPDALPRPREAARHAVRADSLPVRDGRLLFRTAWKIVAGRVEVDLPTAREIVTARVRIERDRRLGDSDREKARLDDVGTPQQRQAMAAYRQALRDLPASLPAALADLTAEQLHDFAPAWPQRAEFDQPTNNR